MGEGAVWGQRLRDDNDPTLAHFAGDVATTAGPAPPGVGM